MHRTEYNCTTGETKIIQLTQEEIDAIPPVVIDLLEVCYAARKAAYKSLEFQMDEIFHNGFEAWHDRIAAVKLQFPKP